MSVRRSIRRPTPSFFAFLLQSPEFGCQSPSFCDRPAATEIARRRRQLSRTHRALISATLSPEGFAEKVRFTVGEMEARLRRFGFGWKDTTAAQIYTVHELPSG